MVHSATALEITAMHMGD